jgi:hypothetical protein
MRYSCRHNPVAWMAIIAMAIALAQCFASYSMILGREARSVHSFWFPLTFNIVISTISVIVFILSTIPLCDNQKCGKACCGKSNNVTCSEHNPTELPASFWISYVVSSVVSVIAELLVLGLAMTFDHDCDQVDDVDWALYGCESLYRTTGVVGLLVGVIVIYMYGNALRNETKSQQDGYYQKVESVDDASSNTPVTAGTSQATSSRHARGARNQFDIDIDYGDH